MYKLLVEVPQEQEYFFFFFFFTDCVVYNLDEHRELIHSWKTFLLKPVYFKTKTANESICMSHSKATGLETWIIKAAEEPTRNRKMKGECRFLKEQQQS